MKKQKTQSDARLNQLQKRVTFYQAGCAVLAMLLLFGLAYVGWRWVRENAVELGLSDIEQAGPFHEEIQRAIEHLAYSGIPNLLHDDVSITIDEKQKTWQLHNLHRFDREGKVALTDGRFGLCGDLAASVYDRIQHLFPGNSYQLEFVVVSESKFFPPPYGTHMVLRITDKKAFPVPRVFILDPSFHMYKRIEQVYEDYMFYDAYDVLPFVQEKRTDESFKVGIHTPILIRNKYILGLMVDGVDDRLDKDNYGILFTLTERYKYAGRLVFALWKKQGKQEMLENKALIKSVLKEQEYEQIRAKILALFETVRFAE